MNFNLTVFKTLSGGLDPEKFSCFRDLIDSKCLIETGTYLGDTVSSMLGVFEEVISIELSDELFKKASERFSGNNRVRLFHGNSADGLHEAALFACEKNPVIWLDAHWSGGNTARADTNTPVIAELKAIELAVDNNSIIVIDDIRYFIDIPHGFDVHEANYGYPKLVEIVEIINEMWPTRRCILNGDLMFIFPEKCLNNIVVSDVLRATNMLRLGGVQIDESHVYEAIVANAMGDERESIMSFPEIFKHSLEYGIGGEFVYWRALVLEKNGELERAAADFSLARKCGFNIKRRPWE